MEKMFVCPICGEKYNSIAALNECVSAHAAEEAEAEKNQKLAKQKAVDEINAKYREFKTLIDKFNEDFDESYSISFCFSSGDTTIGEKRKTSSNVSEEFEDFLKGFVGDSKPANKVADKFEEVSKKLGIENMDSSTKELYEETLKELKGFNFAPGEEKELMDFMNLINRIVD